MRNKKHLTLNLFIFLIALSGCIGGNIEEIDEGKSQIYVGNYDGGVGHAWLEAVAADFEELYAETSFEEEKVGVEIIIDNGKANMAGNSLFANIPGSQNEMFITESVYYFDLVSQKLAYDITDVVTEKLTAYGEDVSILDKLADDYTDYYKYYDNKYYALPFFEGFKGFVYNIDIFEKYGFFILNEGYEVDSEQLNFGNSKSGDLSPGPDGKFGTNDDGMPATYNEFFALLDQMVLYNVDPFIWSGMYDAYLTSTQYQLWADYEGEEMALNYTFSGTATDLVKEIRPDGSVLLEDPVEITSENAYLLQKQAGKYHALQFIKRLVSDSSYYSTKAVSPSESHTAVQLYFILSSLDSSLKNIAMLAEGNWWEMESSGVFEQTQVKYRKGKNDLNFGLMPFPKADASKVGEGRTIVALNDTCIFINSNVADHKIELVKKFYQYIHSEEALTTFNTITGLTRAFDYELSDEQYNKLSTFGKQVYDLKHDENVEIIHAVSTNPTYIKNSSAFVEDEWGFATVLSDNTEYKHPWRAFINNPGLTVEDYFAGLYRKFQSSWSRYLN